MIFQQGCLKVRELEAEDASLLAKWLSDPAVLEFYEGRDNPFDLDKVRDVFFTPEDPETRCIVEWDGRAVGYLQFYPLDEEEKALYGYGNELIYGMDQFIGEPDHWNRGIGSELVTGTASFLTREKRAKRVVMDPRTSNLRAIACYMKCGFRQVMLLPKRELHEGTYEDCWLMEYLPEFKV